MGIINCLSLLLVSSATLGNCAAILNNAVNPPSDHRSPSLLLHSLGPTAKAAATEANQTTVRKNDANDQNRNLHQKLSTTIEGEKKSSPATKGTRELQGVITNLINQIRPQVAANPPSIPSYDTRQQQTPQVEIMKADNSQAIITNQDDGNLARNIVSTVSKAAAIIGNAVLKANNNNNNNNYNANNNNNYNNNNDNNYNNNNDNKNSNSGGLLQGRVVDRVMGAVRSGYGGHDQKSGLVGIVTGVGDNLLDGRLPLIGKLIGSQRPAPIPTPLTGGGGGGKEQRRGGVMGLDHKETVLYDDDF